MEFNLLFTLTKAFALPNPVEKQTKPTLNMNIPKQTTKAKINSKCECLLWNIHIPRTSIVSCCDGIKSCEVFSESLQRSINAFLLCHVFLFRNDTAKIQEISDICKNKRKALQQQSVAGQKDIRNVTLYSAHFSIYYKNCSIF